MKQVKILLLLVATVFLFNSCQKDENGYRITYYKDKIVVGWLFYKFENDSIAPIPNIKMESYCSGEDRGWIFPWSREHTDYVYTDNNGKFTCKLVKKINNDKGNYYKITWGGPLPIVPASIKWKKDNYFFSRDIKDVKIVNIDTVFCNIK
jgi:hypothetical protein